MVALSAFMVRVEGENEEEVLSSDQLGGRESSSRRQHEVKSFAIFETR